MFEKLILYLIFVKEIFACIFYSKYFIIIILAHIMPITLQLVENKLLQTQWTEICCKIAIGSALILTVNTLLTFCYLDIYC